MTMVCALCYITRIHKQKITVWNVEIRVVCHLSFWFSELLMHRLISLSETLSMININIHHCNRRTWQNINKWRLGSFQIWALFVCQFTHFHLAQYLLMKHYKLFFFYTSTAFKIFTWWKQFIAVLATKCGATSYQVLGTITFAHWGR